MALLDILHYPDPRLRNRADPVQTVDGEIKSLVDDMFETMYAAPGIGLAAIQVNVPLQIIVIDLSPEKTEPICLINPKIEPYGEILETEEGCLSVPGVYESVRRESQLRVEALDRNGVSQTFEADGLLAVCIQHECDHLNGKLFVDHLSRLKQQRIRKKALKNQKSSAKDDA
ncbi:MAG: peptide deformylase [Pseudomonadota bacterium]